MRVEVEGHPCGHWKNINYTDRIPNSGLNQGPVQIDIILFKHLFLFLGFLHQEESYCYCQYSSCYYSHYLPKVPNN